MRNVWTRTLALLLVLVMVVGVLPMSVFATEPDAGPDPVVTPMEAPPTEAPTEPKETEAQTTETDEAVKAVQAMMNALTAEVNAENVDAVKAELAAIDTALAGLSDEQKAGLDKTQYNACLSALDTYEGNPGASDPEPIPEAPTTFEVSNSTAAAHPNHPAGEYDSVIFGQLKVVNETVAIKSMTIDLYAGSTKLATTVVNDIAGFLTNGSVYELSWHIDLKPGDCTDAYWTTTWHSKPVVSVVPTHIVTYVNEVNVGQTNVTFNYDGGTVVTSWADMPGVSVAQDSNGNYYESLQDAMSNAASGSTITLLGSITEEGTQIPGGEATEKAVQIPDGKTITLNLGGNTFNGSLYGSGVTLSVTNGTINTVTAASGIELVSNSSLTLGDSVTIIGNSRHAIRLKNSSATISGGSYTSKGSGTMHGLYITNSTANVSGGTFVGGAGGGAATLTATSTLNISGGTFQNPNGDFTIGAWGGILNISGGVFHKSKADTLNLGGSDKGTSDTGITGGYFEEWKSNYYNLLEDSKVAIQMPNGDKDGNYVNWYTIDNAVAKVGTAADGVPYISLKDAVQAATSGKIVTLMQNCAENVTLDAADAAKSITLDLNGKTLTSKITMANEASKLTVGDVTEGSTVTLTTAEPANGYVVMWYKGDNEYVATGTEVTLSAAGAYYFKTVAIDYRIQYELDGGTNAATNRPSYNITMDTITLADPTKTGYTFGGWYTEAAFTNKVTEIAKGSTGDKTLYAKWTVNEYTITYEGLEGATNTNPDKYTVNDTVTLAAPTKEGHKFDGWYTDLNFSGEPVTQIAAGSTGGKTFYAKWTVNKYTITFDVEGIADITADYGTSLTMPVDPTKEGYTFDGWYNGTEKFEATKMPAGNVDLTAKWTANQYTITFDEVGGSEVADITAGYETAITLPTPTKDGHHFIGWINTADETMFAATKMPLNGASLKALWVTEYKITYGAGQKVYKGNAATFISDAPFDKFDSVEVNGQELTKGVHYTVEKGSTEVTIKASFINKLTRDTHTLRIVSEDGYAETTFTVRSAYDADGYDTGDTTDTALWLMIAMAGMAGILATVLGKKYLIKRK